MLEDSNGKYIGLQKDIEFIKLKLQSIETKVDNQFVLKEVFDIRVGKLEKIVYGTVGVLCLSVLAAMLRLIIIN